MFELGAVGLTPGLLALVVMVTLFGGFAKGVVGFAMPLIMFAGLGSFLPVEIALAFMVVPTVVTNFFQAFRHGWSAALVVLRAHWRFVTLLCIFIVIGAQLVPVLPGQALLLACGVPITALAVLQLVGWRLRIAPAQYRVAEVIGAVIAGLLGGMTGTWGSPTVTYLTAINLPKADSVRVQGVMFLLGALFLFGAHLQTGVLNAVTLPWSVAMCVPGFLGMWIGTQVQDRLDQEGFRRATLVVLIFAGLNLVRRGLIG